MPGRSAFTLFKGDVTYINIEKGRHKSDIYLHPSTLARFGDVERVAALVSVGGRLVAMEGLPSGSTSIALVGAMAPQEGYLLNRMQTPFAMISFRRLRGDQAQELAAPDRLNSHAAHPRP
jgi:hypothetical protein